MYRNLNPEAPTSSKPSRTFYNAASRWQWEERAAAYDRWQQQAAEKRLLSKRMKALEETQELGELLRRKAAAVARMFTNVTQRVGEHEGREMVLLSTTMTPRDVALLADVGVKLEQLALGMPTERTSLQNGGMDELAKGLEDAKAELRNRLKEIAKRRDEAEGFIGDGPSDGV
jgi:hypothetical protein